MTIVRTKYRPLSPAIPSLPDFLVASDFDKTLSFNDSGLVLSEMLGIRDFEDRVAGLAGSNLVQQGAELAYLLRHDPDFRHVRREHLAEAGRHVSLKHDVEWLARTLGGELGGFAFQFCVISAGPSEVVRSALGGIVPAEKIFATEFAWDERSGEIAAVKRVPAGFGKVGVLQALESALHVSPDRTIYIGDGSSDMFVMQHVNGRAGHTIAVSEAKSIGRIAQRTVLSDSAASVVVPILEDVLGWEASAIRDYLASEGLALRDWDKVRTDWLSFHPSDSAWRDGARTSPMPAAR